MPVNETLARYSDWSYASAVAVYVLAMVFYLVEQAMTKTRRQTRELAAVGGASDSAEDAPGTLVVTPSPRADRIGRMGFALNVLGVLLHAVAVITRGLATHRVPWGNMYEYGSAVCLFAVIGWLVLEIGRASCRERVCT